MVERVHLAKPRGFCAGVVMAIEAVEDAARAAASEGEPAPLVVYHAIVHNDTVVGRLEREHGVRFVEDLAELDGDGRHGDGRHGDGGHGDGGHGDGEEAATPTTVVFSAHGVSPAVREEARRRRLTTIDATCPLVTKVHNEAKRYAREGYHILLIGDSTRHQEVIGTRGEAPASTTVVSVVGNRKHDPALADPETVVVPDPAKVVVLTQTTLSVDDTMRTVELLRRRFPALVVPPSDDLCYATKNRQDEVKRIAPCVDAFVVVTSTASSNGMRLLELADDLTGRAVRVEGPDDLAPEAFVGARAVGVTSAASTPDDLVQAVVAWFRDRNPDLEVVEEGAWEQITFRKPKREVPEARA